MEQFHIWIALTCITWILAILQIFSLYRFKSIRSLLIVKKRFPILVMVEALLVIVWLLFIIVFWANSVLNATDFGNDSSTHLLFNYGEYPNHLVAHAVTCTEVTRLWLVSYNLHYLNSSQNEKWKSQIDHTFAEKDWYLRNRNKFGNRKYVIIRVFVYYLFAVTIIISTRLINATIAPFVNGLFFSMDVMSVVYIYYTCRKYKELNDNFLFYYEFRATTTIWCFCIFTFFLVMLFDIMGFVNIYAIIFVLNGILAISAPSLLST
eukprot:545685_1